MITVLNIGYNGRFGNQIFQFAAAIGIAKKIGSEALFPLHNLNNGIIQTTGAQKYFTGKIDLLDCFDIDMNYFTDNLTVNSNKTEASFAFDETMFSIGDFTNINGYFQSEKYFEHCKDFIVDTLKIKRSLLEQAKSLLPITDKELVAIHIRRGDYVFSNGYHYLNGLDYFNQAINLFRGDFHFLVFSDDIPWCKSIWGNNPNFTMMEGNSQNIDFTMMTLCHHHIISNSSFSWWSSYLSQNKNKKIIAPKNWFGPIGPRDYDTVYTDNMIKI